MRPGVKFNNMPMLQGFGIWVLFRSACKRIVDSSVFDWVVTMAIFVNAVCFGFQADWSVKNPGEATPFEFEVIEYSLMALFTIELFLRLLPAGAWFLNPKNSDLYWNLLDVFLVITSFLEFAARHFGVDVVKTNITRLCRLGRVVRAVRIVRIIRFFAELRVMVLAIGSSLRLWAELDKRKKWVREVKTLFQRADSKGEGFLDFEAFAQQLQDVRVQEHLKALGLDVMTTDIRTLFELFDFDGGGTIEISEFATALQRMNGGASAVDVASMKFALKGANQHIVGIIGAMESMGFKVPKSHFGSNSTVENRLGR